MQKKTAVIIGAGPAGLTAAYELLQRTDIKPIVLEMSGDIGGISKTVNYKGNRIDIGGHRFFSKSDRVSTWWTRILPLQGKPAIDDIILERTVPLSTATDAPDPETTDKVMLIRNRLSRIFFLKRFFDYPITLNCRTFSNLGLVRITKIALSYLKACLYPIKKEKSLEDFLINRFGKELYLTFFKDYTHKVWGIPCDKIGPEWGAQRIKGLSVKKAIGHALRKVFIRDSSIRQAHTETSLIEQFMYPKLGPGQMWEEVARQIESLGGRVVLHQNVISIKTAGNVIVSVTAKDDRTGAMTTYSGDYFFSSMPVKDLVRSLDCPMPTQIKELADGLIYRDFVTVGILVKKLLVKNETKIKTIDNSIPDCWVYIQERQVKVGRLQVFNNWSPYMVANNTLMWLGLEYFCNEGDELWSKPDEVFMKFAVDELAEIGIIDPHDVLDSTIIRMPKTYPAYFGTYDRFETVRQFSDRFENLFLVGRNGMHKYNNADHSMLTAMVAVDNIANNIISKDNIWAVNTEGDYHEESKKTKTTLTLL
jgi:protoporphyrinogen oxidase